MLSAGGPLLADGKNRLSRMIVILPAYLAAENDTDGPVASCLRLFRFCQFKKD